jgi:hypothetical protein
LQITIPGNIGCGVRVAATDIRIPRTGHAVIRKLPANIPTINRTGPAVGNGYFGNQTCAPIIGDLVTACRQRGLVCAEQTNAAQRSNFKINLFHVFLAMEVVKFT